MKKIIVILFIVASFILAGCSPGKIDDLKENSNVVTEYNDMIAVYNKLALSFTDFAKHVDKGIEDKKLGEEFWGKYKTHKLKVEGNIKKVQEQSYQTDKLESALEDIEVLIEKVSQYMGELSLYENKEDARSKENFIKIHEDLYPEILKQSKKVVNEIEVVYNKKIINKQ